MDGRVRSPCRPTSSANKEERFRKFLKPGALAKLRDSKLSARSLKPRLQIPISFFHSSSPSHSDSAVQTIAQIVQIDGFPYFSVVACGPRCPQRKKLVAAKSMLLASSPVQEPVLDVLNADLLVAP